jgi:hypothetical protein
VTADKLVKEKRAAVASREKVFIVVFMAIIYGNLMWY